MKTVGARTKLPKLQYICILVVDCRDCRGYEELAGHFWIGRAFGRAYFSCLTCLSAYVVGSYTLLVGHLVI